MALSTNLFRATGRGFEHFLLDLSTIVGLLTQLPPVERAAAKAMKNTCKIIQSPVGCVPFYDDYYRPFYGERWIQVFLSFQMVYRISNFLLEITHDTRREYPMVTKY